MAPEFAQLVVHERFRDVARRHADRVALEWPGGSLTYGELDGRSDAVAARLGALDLPEGARVAMPATRSPETVVAMLGVLKAGCAYVPIDGSYPPAVVDDYLARSDAGAIIAGAGPLPAVSSLPRVSLPDAEAGPRPPAPPSAPAGPETPAYVMFTSGTTGEPKGVLVPHRGIVRLVCGASYVTVGAQDRFLLLSPVTFDASTFEIWGALLNGAALVIYPDGVFDPRLLRETVRDHRVSVLWLTAGLFHLIARHAVDALEGVRVLLAGGDVIQPDAVRAVLRRHPALTFVNGYGPTENTTFTCCHVMGPGSHVGETIPIGRPITGTTVRVLDADRRPVERGQAGELYAGGLGVALGYLHAPEATARAFVPDPDHPATTLYRTGDLVRELPDGAIEFIGRTDSLVKIRGYRVSVKEVERRIQRLDGVDNALVAAETDDSGARYLVAYVQSDRDPRQLRRSLRSALERELPPYMVPAMFHVCAEFPLTRNGKIDARALLRAEDAGGSPSIR